MITFQFIDGYNWLIPKFGNMRVDAVVYGDEALVNTLKHDGTLNQLISVAALPGIRGNALAMPDAHQGYGFPIGGVAAFDLAEGVISPGGVGYDINCGVRVFRTSLFKDDLSPDSLEKLANQLFSRIPAGAGAGRGLALNSTELNQVLARGAEWVVKKGMGTHQDLELCESGGKLDAANPEAVSPRALKRGISQLGTLGGGNHFLEVSEVETVFDPKAADCLGIQPGQLLIWIHSGSRGLGHQVCDDYLRELGSAKEAIHQPDRQLISAPVESMIGKRYFSALSAAANFAFANRQVLTWMVREVIGDVLSKGPAELKMGLIWDVAHNIAKVETHELRGHKVQLMVHRKGATRALGPGHAEIPGLYRSFGQPVLLPGDMGTASHILVGTSRAEKETFASSAHGAGRLLSRTQARKQSQGRRLDQELAAQNIIVRAESPRTLAEEMPQAYKDVDLIARILHQGGICKMVARTKPLVVIKG